MTDGRLQSQAEPCPVFVKFCPRCEERLHKLPVGWACEACGWKTG